MRSFLFSMVVVVATWENVIRWLRGENLKRRIVVAFYYELPTENVKCCNVKQD